MATTPSRRAGPAQRSIDLMHGKFRIVAGTHKETHKAIAYLGSKPVEVVEGDSPEAALEIMRDILDDRVAKQRKGRVDGVPIASEYADAFASLGDESRQRAVDLFVTHARHPGRRARLEEIARRFGNERQAIEDYLSYCRKLSAPLDYAPRAEDCPKVLLPALAVAEIDTSEPALEPVLAMRAELAEAVEGLWRERRDRAAFRPAS